MRVLPFKALGYSFEDMTGLSTQEYDTAVRMLLIGASRVTPEIRCADSPLKNTIIPTERTALTELTEEESLGDIHPLHFAAFDDQRNIVGAFGLFAIHIVSETPKEVTVRARPWPAFNHLDGQEWAEHVLDMMKFLIDNTLTLADGRKLHFIAMETSTYYKDPKDSDYTSSDARIKAAETLFTSGVIKIDIKVDDLGRTIYTLRRPK